MNSFLYFGKPFLKLNIVEAQEKIEKIQKARKNPPKITTLSVPKLSSVKPKQKMSVKIEAAMALLRAKGIPEEQIKQILGVSDD